MLIPGFSFLKQKKSYISSAKIHPYPQVDGFPGAWTAPAGRQGPLSVASLPGGTSEEEGGETRADSQGAGLDCGAMVMVINGDEYSSDNHRYINHWDID